MTTESFFFLVIMTGEWSWQTFSIVLARFCLAFVYVMASIAILLYMYINKYNMDMGMST